jgi:hypothetical protein
MPKIRVVKIDMMGSFYVGRHINICLDAFIMSINGRWKILVHTQAISVKSSDRKQILIINLATIKKIQ